MGKRRRSKGFRVINFDRPQRSRQRVDLKRPFDRKEVFRWLYDQFAGSNGGKLLHSMESRGEYFWTERNRRLDVCYYMVRSRGNFLYVNRQRWVRKGADEGVNTFAEAFLGDKGVVYHREDKQILKVPYRQYELFMQRYRELTPDLEWFDSN
jgi:hypothetical protein